MLPILRLNGYKITNPTILARIGKEELENLFLGYGYKPEELFDENGQLRPELAELAPRGERRMGANPHANGGLLLKNLKMPDFRTMQWKFANPAV